METEFVSEVSEINPMITAETPTPVSSPVVPVDININGTTTSEDTDRRFGNRKVENADGTISYGLKVDGTPRRKPGRKPKSAS